MLLGEGSWALWTTGAQDILEQQPKRGLQNPCPSALLLTYPRVGLPGVLCMAPLLSVGAAPLTEKVFQTLVLMASLPSLSLRTVLGQWQENHHADSTSVPSSWLGLTLPFRRITASTPTPGLQSQLPATPHLL